MKILLTIPHYYKDLQGPYGSTSSFPELRLQALTQSILATHQLYGKNHCEIIHAQGIAEPFEQHFSAEIDIVICTSNTDHLIDHLRPLPNMYRHHNSRLSDAKLLGFQCHEVLRDGLGQYDYYCYMEDDLVLQDPLHFVKLSQFNKQFGNEKVWQPYRFEMTYQLVMNKIYIDGPLQPELTAPFQQAGGEESISGQIIGFPLTFYRASNPHAGCFFLNAEQMAHWARQPYFLDRDISFLGPLESAATLGVIKTFGVYKTAREYACLLEVMHYDYRYTQLLSNYTAVEATR